MKFSVESAQDKMLAITVQYYMPVGDIVIYEVNVKKWRNVALDLFEFELQTVARKFGKHIEGDSRLGKCSSEVKLKFDKKFELCPFDCVHGWTKRAPCA